MPEIFLLSVQMHPPTLNLTKNRNSYSLRWETQKTLSYITFEVQYKKKSESWEVRSRTRGTL